MSLKQNRDTEKTYINYSKILGIDDTINENIFTLKFKDLRIENEFNLYICLYI